MSVQIHEFRPEDAAAVARMFEASDPMWPGGFDDGLRFPDEALLRSIEEDKALGTYIAWVGEDAVGFADLFKTSEEKVGYLGLLNSDPAYHGRGVGRDLIRRIINKCVELGYKRLDLDTWPGNTRAVPLYKKTGFGWGPEAGELQNHMPLLLSHALTRSYFEQVDWYERLQRELRLGNDVERRNGALIFSYSWDTEAGSLRAVFDQKAKALSELDTPELYLSLEAEQFEMLQGQEQTVRLHVHNRRERSLPLAISASGGDPVSSSEHRAAQVDAGERQVVDLKATAADDKVGEGAVKLNVVVDGAEVEMTATVKVRAVLELELEPAALPLCPGRTVQAYLNLRSRLPERAKVEMLVAPSVGLEATLEEPTLDLAPGEARGTPIALRATTSGQHSLTLSPVVVRGEKREARPPLKVELAAAGPGEVVVLRQEKETTLLTQDVALKVSHKGTGGATLRDRESDQVLVNLSLGVGPPFWPSKLDEQEFPVSVETTPGSATLVVSDLIQEPEGVFLDRRLTMRADGAVLLSTQVRNVGAEERKLIVRQNVERRRPERALFLPLAEGIVRGQEAGQPYWFSELAEQVPQFAEQWIALEWPNWTVGVIWPEAALVRMGHGDWAGFSARVEEATVRPGETLALEAVDVVPSRGGWREIQRAWTRSRGKSAGNEQLIAASGVRLLPSPVLVAGGSATATLEARTDFARITGGEVRVESSGRLGVDPALHTFPSIHTSAPGKATITLTQRGEEPFAAEINMESSLPAARGRYTAPVIALGAPAGQVRVLQEEVAGEAVWCVENGWLSFGVRPSVLGLVYSLATAEGEHLYTNFPQPQPRHWDYPVYGGIRPVLWERDAHRSHELGRLSDVTLDAEEVEREGSQGVRWHGLRLGADLAHESLVGLRFEIEYLTVPGSNVLAVLAQVRSLGPARYVSYRLEMAPANAPEVPVLLLPDQAQVARGGIHGDWNATGSRWVSVEYSGTGNNTVLVTAHGDGVEAYDMGADGIILSGARRMQVPARGNESACHYVVLASDRHQASLYGHLADLAGL